MRVVIQVGLGLSNEMMKGTELGHTRQRIRHEGRARERKSECERFFQNSKMTFPCESFKPFNMHC